MRKVSTCDIFCSMYVHCIEHCMYVPTYGELVSSNGTAVPSAVFVSTLANVGKVERTARRLPGKNMSWGDPNKRITRAFTLTNEQQENHSLIQALDEMIKSVLSRVPPRRCVTFSARSSPRRWRRWRSCGPAPSSTRWPPPTARTGQRRLVDCGAS